MAERGTNKGERTKGDPSPFTQADEASTSSSDGRSYSADGNASDSNASSGDGNEHIAREAYYRAERRGFAPGNEIDDWLEAERQLASQPAQANNSNGQGRKRQPD